jgi:hypothetical protein
MNPTIKSIKLFGTISLCLVIVFASFFAEAQTLKFQKVYGGYSYDYGNDLIQTADSGYLLLCTSNSFSNSSDFYLLKVDQQGNYEWQHTYGGNEIEGACKIKFTQDGNIVIAGHTSSYLNNSYDFYLVKANMNGDTLWTKHYGTNEWDFANSMDTCADGGFIMAGKTYDTGNAYSDIMIVKTDADGNEQWQKKIGGNLDDVANSILSTTDGYLLCGATNSIGAGGKDIYIVKIDLSGNVVWERTLGGNQDDVSNSLMITYDNGIVCGGGVKSYGFPSNYNSYLMKLNLDGTDFWSLPGNYSASTVNFEIIDFVESVSNQIVSISDFDSNGLSNGEFGLFINSSNGYLDTSSTFGGSFKEIPSSIIATNDNGYAIIGTTNSFGMGLSNVFLVKTDSVGTSNSPLSIFVNLKETNQLVAAQNQIYPNPFNTSTTINIDFPVSLVASNAFTIKVLDQLGNEVSNQVAYTVKDNNNGSAITINNRSLSNGMYYYSLSINDKAIAQGKFTIIK